MSNTANERHILNGKYDILSASTTLSVISFADPLVVKYAHVINDGKFAFSRLRTNKKRFLRGLY